MANPAFYRPMQWLRESVESGDQPIGLLEAARRIGQTIPNDEQRIQTLLKVVKIPESPASADVKVAVANAIVDQKDPVEVYFDNFPTPEQHEALHMETGKESAMDAYRHALSLFSILAFIHGVQWFNAKCKVDPVLDYLMMSVTNAFYHKRQGDHRYAGYGIQILHLGLARRFVVPGGRAFLRHYSEPTRNVLEYFGWVVLGRKDMDCLVSKPWQATHPVQLMTNGENLSLLPGLQEVPARDKEPFSRLSRVFQITFNQFLMSVAYNVNFHVASAHGMVQVRPNHAGKLSSRWENLGKAGDLDLSRSDVRAALHHCSCTAIQHAASSLLELFFRPSCSEIGFASFVPRNAESTTELKGGRMRFNMEAAHTIAVLTTTSGFRFALDPSAAQFGWVETLAPFAEYSECRIDHITSYEPREARAPPSRVPTTPTRLTPRPEGEAELGEWTRRWIAEDIEELAEAYFRSKGGFRRVIELRPYEFDAHCRALAANLRSEMRQRDRLRFFGDELSSDSEDEPGSAARQ